MFIREKGEGSAGEADGREAQAVRAIRASIFAAVVRLELRSRAKNEIVGPIAVPGFGDKSAIALAAPCIHGKARFQRREMEISVGKRHSSRLGFRRKSRYRVPAVFPHD